MKDHETRDLEGAAQHARMSIVPDDTRPSAAELAMDEHAHVVGEPCPECDGAAIDEVLLVDGRDLPTVDAPTVGRVNDGPRHPQPHDQKPLSMQTLTQYKP